MAGWCTWIAVLGCATVGIARADRLTLKDGRELVGKVVRVGDRVRLVGRFGEVEFDADEVAGVEQELTPWERWAAAFKTLRPGDLKRALELCELASELRVRSEIPKVLRRGADPSRLDPADPQLLAAVELCADHRLPELRIALLVLAADAHGRVVEIRAPHPSGDARRLTLMRFVYDDEGRLVEAHDAELVVGQGGLFVFIQLGQVLKKHNVAVFRRIVILKSLFIDWRVIAHKPKAVTYI